MLQFTFDYFHKIWIIWFYQSSIWLQRKTLNHLYKYTPVKLLESVLKQISNIQKFSKPRSDQPHRQCICGFLVRETRCHLFVQSTSPLKPQKLAIFSAVICNPKCCILFMYFWLMSLPSIFTCANFCPGLIAGWHENFHFHFFIFYFPLYFYFSQFSLGQTFAQVWSRAGINIFTFILLMFYFHFSLWFFTVFTCANFAQVWSRAGMKIRKGAISWQCPRCSRNEMPKSKKLAALLSRESVETVKF